MKLMIRSTRDGRRVVVTAPEYDTALRLTHAGGQETGHVIVPAFGGPGWVGAHYGIAPPIAPEGALGPFPYAHVHDALEALEAHLQEPRA